MKNKFWVIASITILVITLCAIGLFCTRTAQLNRRLRSSNALRYDIASQISSDGKWFIYQLSETSISIASLEFPFQSETIELPPIVMPENRSWGWWFYYQWSPDSTAILLPLAIGKGCPSDEFVILSLEDGKWSQQVHYQPDNPTEEPTCFIYQWENDSKRIVSHQNGLYSLGDSFVLNVFDLQDNFPDYIAYEITAEEFNAFPMPEFVISPFWMEEGFLLTLSEGFDSTWVILVPENDPEKAEQLIEIVGRYSIFGIDPSGTRILLVKNASADFELPNQYILFNMIDQKIERKEKINNDEYSSIHLNPFGPMNNSVIGANCIYDTGTICERDQPCRPYEAHLISWDWSSLDFKDFGLIKGLIGWDKQREGYLVVKDSQCPNYDKVYFDLIRP